MLGLRDRYIVGRNRTWSVPPVNTLLKGDYSEILATPTRPPFERWWEQGDSACYLARASAAAPRPLQTTLATSGGGSTLAA